MGNTEGKIMEDGFESDGKSAEPVSRAIFDEPFNRTADDKPKGKSADGGTGGSVDDKPKGKSTGGDVVIDIREVVKALLEEPWVLDAPRDKRFIEESTNGFFVNVLVTCPSCETKIKPFIPSETGRSRTNCKLKYEDLEHEKTTAICACDHVQKSRLLYLEEPFPHWGNKNNYNSNKRKKEKRKAQAAEADNERFKNPPPMKPIAELLYCQVFAHLVEKNANKTLKKLKEGGLDNNFNLQETRPLFDFKGDLPWYKVRVGPITPEDYDSVVEKLTAMGIDQSLKITLVQIASDNYDRDQEWELCKAEVRSFYGQQKKRKAGATLAVAAACFMFLHFFH